MSRAYKEQIDQSHVYDVASVTPLELAANLSRRLDNRLWLKREDQQPVFSFKLRGAYNKMRGLAADKLAKGVITASAGNHAQGVAMSAQALKTHAVIVMPATTPQIKVDAVSAWGAEVILHGDSYDDAAARAFELADRRGLYFVHPYDDPEIIAGQGAIGKEILEQHPDPLHAIFVPVGGGGLIAGIAAYVKAVRPEVRVIGVEPTDADAMYRSLRAGKRVVLEQVGIFADGVAVRQVGEETFRLAQSYVDDVVRVGTDAICAAIKDVFEDTRTVLEPAGALAVAGAKAYVEQHAPRNRELVAIASGANMNFDRLRHVSERTELGERREGILAVTIPERPGSFHAFCRMIGSRSITEFNYRYADDDQAQVFVGIRIKNADELRELVQRLLDEGYPTVDLTDNEMAKIHVRHLVGGHAPGRDSERVFRFQFPERPGALLEFLTRIGQRWNISLFHYRNHGSDFGRVLCGLQIPKEEGPAFADFLSELDYRHAEETGNPAYRIFLS